VNSSGVDVLASTDGPAEAANSVAAPLGKRPTWEKAEGSPLPLGVMWIEEEQAFNFAVHSEHAESVTLLLYSPADLVNPLLRLELDFLHHKTGRIWHCRIPVTELGAESSTAQLRSAEGPARPVREVHFLPTRF
jgi:pullulanase/glycogen debranching enzyme